MIYTYKIFLIEIKQKNEGKTFVTPPEVKLLSRIFLIFTQLGITRKIDPMIFKRISIPELVSKDHIQPGCAE